MDPTACWERIRTALMANNTLEAIDAASDLKAWLDDDGAMPDVEEWRGSSRWTYVWSVLSFFMKLDAVAMREALDT